MKYHAHRTNAFLKEDKICYMHEFIYLASARDNCSMTCSFAVIRGVHRAWNWRCSVTIPAPPNALIRNCFTSSAFSGSSYANGNAPR